MSNYLILIERSPIHQSQTVNRWENRHFQPSPIAMKLMQQKLQKSALLNRGMKFPN
ncbi:MULTISPECIES: hypothetical protein [Aphanizomenon]|uniref:Uncharacterized protein n=1 Tax=Aphanizomenon flos-aquae FACHB-1040 TaxID=2692887 RepID=A0ABR8BV70_APHFL|nr:MULTISPECIES: hypothetical protein [Aphanizomenon]MBD2278521.1 hypothetical protein [Aphanizomenon flos-aquae FACHB-1040]QSV70388.1 MAG: hypothetical protein HEQ20_05915 [Aphanizomenon flos-aquae KM1D3_PB]